MELKKPIETIQSIITIVAIIVGGLWTYNLFIKERKNIPHTNIELQLSHIKLSNEINLLHVGIKLTNAGNTLLSLKKYEIRIQQVLPILPCKNAQPCAVKQVNDALRNISRKENHFSWPLIAKRKTGIENTIKIEPGED